MVGIVPREVAVGLEPYLGVVAGKQELFPVAHSWWPKIKAKVGLFQLERGRDKITLAAIRDVYGDMSSQSYHRAVVGKKLGISKVQSS